MKRILAFLPILILVSCAAGIEPPTRLPVPEPQPLTQEQEDLVPIITLCKKKAQLAVVIFAAREEGHKESEVLEKVKSVTAENRAKGEEIPFFIELDSYRMTRDIFRKDSRGEYKIPLDYIKKFTTAEYRMCMDSLTRECEVSVAYYSDGTSFCDSL